MILGVKLSDASKKLGKKFATGASVVKVYIFRPHIVKASYNNMYGFNKSIFFG